MTDHPAQPGGSPTNWRTILPRVLTAGWFGVYIAIYLVALTLDERFHYDYEAAKRAEAFLFACLDWFALLCLGGYTALCAARQGKPFRQSWPARFALLTIACTLAQRLVSQTVIDSGYITILHVLQTLAWIVLVAPPCAGASSRPSATSRT